jgi:hypothetical protein
VIGKDGGGDTFRQMDNEDGKRGGGGGGLALTISQKCPFSMSIRFPCTYTVVQTPKGTHKPVVFGKSNASRKTSSSLSQTPNPTVDIFTNVLSRLKPPEPP